MNGEPERKGRSPVLAAFLILFGTGIVFYFLPRIMIALGSFSPWLAGAFGGLIVLGFFLVFWLRARYQRSRGN